MKCVVIYFSLTGNTEKVTRAIQTGIKEAADHCDIFPIKEANPKCLYEYDLIGIGSPVMSPYFPINVEDFIKAIRFVGGKHAFSFCTHCSLWYNYFPSAIPILQERGLTVIGWQDWFGSSFGPIGEPTPYPTDGHPDEIDLREAEAFGREMVSRSRRISNGETGLIPEAPPFVAPPPKPLGMKAGVRPPNYYVEKAKEMNFRLLYDREKCRYPKCRLCMDICPVYGIDLSVDPPVIGEPCMNCGGMCDQVCPTGAMEVDAAHVDAARQHLGGAEGFELLKKRMKEYEDQGIFRPLIPEDKIGWDTLVYDVYTKHPRFVVGKGRPYGPDPWSWRP